MEDGKQPADIEVDMKLSVMKPLSARWIISILELRLELCVVDLWRQESVRQQMKLRVTVIQKITLLPILMNSRYLATWYNIIQPSACVCVCVCVSELSKQTLIFQWLNFGEFEFF